MANSGNLGPLVKAAGAAVNSIKLNGISTGRHDGRAQLIKQRRIVSEQIASLANLFFPMADAHVTVCATPREWQRWEIQCYRMLNGDQFRAFRDGPRTVRQDKLPGRNLRQLNKSGKLTRRALAAAAKEIRRAHRFRCPEFDGQPWSHGDLHMGNVIYDPRTDRARLIDFELIHDKTLSTTRRHADDLLAFVQEMIGTVPDRRWLPLSLYFLKSYGRPRVVNRLRTLLVVPDGIAGFWWKIRCNFCDGTRMRRRCNALRRALDRGKVPHVRAPPE